MREKQNKTLYGGYDVEFNEKLQELRKSRGLTQEELASALYVSRTAVSKWESGKGYPSIDSLKEISGFFSVTIDDLLSCEELVSVARNERRESVRKICGLFFGVTDLLSVILMFLPFYAKSTAHYIYAVNLFAYAETTSLNKTMYFILFGLLAVFGAAEIALTLASAKCERLCGALTASSLAVGTAAVLFTAIAREPYAACTVFLLTAVKTAIVFCALNVERGKLK